MKVTKVPIESQVQQNILHDKIINVHGVTVADIVFILKDKPHPLFERKENDLIYTPEISLVIVSTITLI